MKKITTILLAFIGLFTMNTFAQVDSTTLNSSIITSTVTLNASTRYLMKGNNKVRIGGNLVIPPGTVIMGDFNSKGVLIIERNGKIFANGTVSQPIVFTSSKPAGQRGPGDWGGVIILGRAGINTSSGADSAEIEGFGAGLGPIYGGQPRVDNDSSGVFRYVRLEFPGVNLTSTSGNEINGLTMGGVGSRTVIEYVQVSYCGDDAFEWFGGTVNCRYLIAYKSIDDDWDTDNGFRGQVQFGLSVKDTGLYDVSGSNGFESDNNNNNPTSGTFNSPRTKPIFSNMTVVGPFINTSLIVNSLHQRGSHERRASQECIYNSIIMGFRVGVRFDGTPVYDGCTGDTIQYRNNVFAGNVRLADTAGSTTFNAQAWLQNPTYVNTVYATANEVQLINPFGIYPDPSNATVDYWIPQGGSPVLVGANFVNPNLLGMQVVTHRGAFGLTNWTAGWAVFNPKNYVIGIQQISGNVPSKFNLAQNYPNPFNPTTNIKFDIPSAGYAVLKVYNSVGQEVAVLVNNSLATGSYVVDFNASSLASGVYFYSLEITPNGSESAKLTHTKKMMLVK